MDGEIDDIGQSFWIYELEQAKRKMDLESSEVEKLTLGISTSKKADRYTGTNASL